jgi:predicted  nucleic acid-binding Zn-ribbon protein
MSDSQAYEAITVASDGVTVTKRFEADEFPVPAIAFNVVSKRSETVNIRLVDTVPDDVAVEDLGFHPEYGSEFWDINDDKITFEKEIEPDSDYTTVYGIRATGTDDVEKFLTEPVIESVDPPLDEDEEDLVGGGNNAVKDVIAGDSDSVPGLEDDEDEDIETLNLKDPNNPNSEAVADGEDADGDGTTAADGEATEAPTGNVIAAMANEIRQNNVSAADVKMLKRALDAVSQDTDPEGGVNTARINRIQNDIADLRAYTDALEEFLAENGTGDEVIEEFSERLDSFETELDSFEDEIGSAKSAAQAATDGLEELDGDVDSLENGLDDVEGTVDAIEGDLSDLEAEIDDVREEIGDGELDDRISDVEDEIVELKEWREQLSSVIGGGSE